MNNMEVRKLCMYQAYDHIHTHKETHTHEHNNNPISIVHLFSKPCMYDTNSKILLLFLNISLLESSTTDYIWSKMSESRL